MEMIRSWWEVPCVAHFCHIFKKPFKLPSFEIEEFEDTVLLDCFPSPSKLIVQIFCTFLDGIIDMEINEDNWPLMLKLHLKWRCDNLKEKWNPLSGETEYKDLDTYSRVLILHKLCHWRLELDDIGDLLRGMDGPSLRMEPVGKDMDGNTYWYFYGTRLYKEKAKKKKKRKETSEEITPAKVPAKAGKRGKEATASTGRRKGAQNKGNTPSSRRGRGKQTVQENVTPTGRRSGRNRRNHQVVEEEEEEESNGGVESGKGGEISGDRNSGGVENGAVETAETVEGGVVEGAVEGGRVEGAVEGGVVEEGVVEGAVESGAVEGGKQGSKTEEEGDNSSEKSHDASNGAGLVSVLAESGWSVACTTVEEWNQVMESLKGSKHAETKRLLHALQDFFPEVEHVYNIREKRLKKRLLAEMPRRSSDRIAIKAAVIEEEERQEALEREMQRQELRQFEEEEQRAKEEVVERKRQKRMEEAVQRRKFKEEQQEKLRIEEESNWEKAMSGELSGRRKAAIGAAENVSEVQRLAEDFMLTDKDFDLYIAMHKIIAGLRKHEEAWIFEDPVTETIAPGYFEVVDKPMDYVTVEKKVEEQVYKSKEEFISDVDLIYDNCCDYNGEESEYFELSEEVRKLFHALVGVHFEGKSVADDKPEGKGKKGQHRDSRSPSACKTPELTSESSSEEDSAEEGSDESYTEGECRPPKKAKSALKLTPSLEQHLSTGLLPRMPGSQHPHHFLPHGPPPQFYPNYMHQFLQHRMPRPPHMPPGADMYPPRSPYLSRLPPPYPGFTPDHGSAPRPPPVGMYPPFSEHHQAMYPPHPPPHQDMMPRHMYPSPNHYPSHPAHPAHPHHAAYRQQMMYEMQYHGMGMRPGGMRPGMGPRPRMEAFHGMRPTHSPFPDTKSGSPVCQYKLPDQQSVESRAESTEAESTKAHMSDNELDEQKKEGVEGGGSRVKEQEVKKAKKVEEVVTKKKQQKVGLEEQEMLEEGNKESEEMMDKVKEKEEQDEVKEKKEQDEVKEKKEQDEVKEKKEQDEVKEKKEQDKVKEEEQVDSNGRTSQNLLCKDQNSKSIDAEIDRSSEGDSERTEDSKAATANTTTNATGKSSDRMHMTPEQMEKYRYHQHMMALHQQRREAMSRGYPFPPHAPLHIPHPSHPDEAAAAYYAHHYGGPPGYPPNLHATDPRQMEAAHHHHQQLQLQQQQYWMEMEARRRQHYIMMKQTQDAQNRRQQQQREGDGKERSAETGQEGLEDVPDYQESLRQYALRLGGKPANRVGGEATTLPSHEKQGESLPDGRRKRKASDNTSSPQPYPPHLPAPIMPNGYPMLPYHMPPYNPSHAHHLTLEERRNGVGFPSDYGSPHYRMPGGYPGSSFQHLPDEAWRKSGPVKQQARETPEENVATPPAKRPCPSS